MRRSLLSVAALVLALGANACASGQWRTPELVALGAAETAVAADCGTTVVALRDAELVETNPLLGLRPSTEGLALACAAAGTAVWAVGERTRGTWRLVWLGAIFGAGLLNATHNLGVINSQTSGKRVTVSARFTF